MDEITVLETREVLKRLVRERKALEHGLAAADQLANIEAAITDRKALLDNLVIKCEERNAELVSLDENISYLNQRHTAACEEREKESKAELSRIAKDIEEMKAEYVELKSAYEGALEAQKEHHEKVSLAMREEIKALEASAADLRAAVEDLRSSARKLAGV